MAVLCTVMVRRSALGISSRVTEILRLAVALVLESRMFYVTLPIS